MTIGGASPERLREIGLVQAGLVGCIKEVGPGVNFVGVCVCISGLGMHCCAYSFAEFHLTVRHGSLVT